jgi:excisionase family DNA binding protein
MRQKIENTGKGVNTDDMEEFYTVDEACAAMKISRATIYRYLKTGLLTAIKVPGKGKGGHFRFRQIDLDKFAKKFTYRPELALA